MNEPRICAGEAAYSPLFDAWGRRFWAPANCHELTTHASGLCPRCRQAEQQQQREREASDAG